MREEKKIYSSVQLERIFDMPGKKRGKKRKKKGKKRGKKDSLIKMQQKNQVWEKNHVFEQLSSRSVDCDEKKSCQRNIFSKILSKTF